MIGQSGDLKGSFLIVFYFLLNCSTVWSQPGSGFVPNRSQWPDDVQFVSRIPGGRMIIGPGSFRYHFVENDHDAHLQGTEITAHADAGQVTREHLVQVNFVGSNHASVPQPSDPAKEYYNFYFGSDPCRWATGVHAYNTVTYPAFYAGIDLRVYSAGENMKYDLILRPGADPSQVNMLYDGAGELAIRTGDLFVKTTLGEIIEKKPYAFQLKDGRQMPVACEYLLQGNCVSFVFPDGYDPCDTVVIDPLLIFSTYSGSAADNWGSTATPGENGTLYSAGVTTAQWGGVFPATSGAFQKTNHGQFDIGILKYDSAGGTLLFATYLGGNGSESAHSLVVNDNNELVLLGTTSSADFPTTSNGFDREFSGGGFGSIIGIPYTAGADLIVCKFNAVGSSLLASTFLGGTGQDGVNTLNGPLVRNYGDELRGDVITDADDNIYLSTVTSSANFPGMNGFDATFAGGGTDGLVLKMTSDLSTVIWSTFLGGSGADACYSIKFDSDGNVLVAGGTTSPDFPVTVNAYQPALAGDADGWIVRLSADGSAVLHATFTGTSAYDQVYFLDINAANEVYVYGQTSGDFPVFPDDVYRNPGSGQFLQKLTPELDSALLSTVFGSGRDRPDISPTAFLVNDCNHIFMTGWGGGINANYWGLGVSTEGMPLTDDAFQKSTSGNDFYFIVLGEDATRFLYGTYMGGTGSLTHVDGGTSRFDKTGIVYHAVCAGCRLGQSGSSSDFPSTPGAWSRTNRSQNCNNAAFKFDLTSLRALLDVDYEGINVCTLSPVLFENKSIGGVIYKWDFGDGTRVTKTNIGPIYHTYQEKGQYIAKLVAIDSGTCRIADSVMRPVTVYQQTIEFGPDGDICEGSSYTLFASGGVMYSWTGPDPDFSSNVPTPAVSPKDTTEFYVTVTNADGCVRKDTVLVNVVPAIKPMFVITREGTCFEKPEVTITNTTDSLMEGDQMYFDVGDGTMRNLPEFPYEFPSEGLHRITLHGVREFCHYQTSVDIPVFRLTVPNVITPGASPGKNDVFFVRYGDDMVGPADFGYQVSLLVYNRWGRIVYEDNDYLNDWSGDDLPAGVYYYEVKVADHATCRDWLHVVR